jgi:hypothetical protein
MNDQERAAVTLEAYTTPGAESRARIAIGASRHAPYTWHNRMRPPSRHKATAKRVLQAVRRPTVSLILATLKPARHTLGRCTLRNDLRLPSLSLTYG